LSIADTSMETRSATPARDDQSRPPIFTAEEWRALIRSLALSPRQAQVVGLAMQSRKDKEIARMLRIEESTVYTHIKVAKLRLNAVDRVGIAYRVFECFRTVIENRTSS
jgi:DNA-binding NarL/FixJ family response regulator